MQEAQNFRGDLKALQCSPFSPARPGTSFYYLSFSKCKSWAVGFRNLIENHVHKPLETERLSHSVLRAGNVPLISCAAIPCPTASWGQGVTAPMWRSSRNNLITHSGGIFSHEDSQASTAYRLKLLIGERGEQIININDNLCLSNDLLKYAYNLWTLA